MMAPSPSVDFDHRFSLFDRREEEKPAPQSYNNEIESYIKSSARIATEILHPEKYDYTEKSRRIGRVERRSYPFMMPIFMPSPTPVCITHGAYPSGRRPADDGKPGDALRWIAGIASAVIGGYAIYKVGQTINHLRDTGDEIKDNYVVKEKISAMKHEWRTGNARMPGHGNENKYLQSLERIAEKRESIFRRIRGNAQTNLLIMICLVATAVFGVLGAVFASYPLMGGALLFGLATGAAFLFKLGYASSDKSDEKDATVIKQEIDTLKGSPYMSSLKS